MKIAFVTFEYPPFIIGGAGVYAFSVTHELAKLGHHLVIFVPDIPGIEYDINTKNIEFRRVKINKKLPFNALHYWLHLPAEVKKEELHKKFDIIHFNGISYWFLKKKISKAPHVVTIHHLVIDTIQNNKTSIGSRIRNIRGETSFFIPLLEKRCIESADKIISVSDFTKNQIINTYKINSNKINVIYNGIDLNGYNFSQEEINETKKQLNLDGESIILFVGRINDPRKGLTFLLHCFKQVLISFNVKLVVIGKGDQTEARNLSESLEISNNVLFTGFVSETDLKKYYSLCDIYVCPSKLEGFGLTIIEAMAAGKPIVATKVGAIPELITHEINGFLVESGNSDEMVSSICALLQNKYISQKIGTNNLSKVLKYNWHENAKVLSKYYTIVTKE